MRLLKFTLITAIMVAAAINCKAKKYGNWVSSSLGGGGYLINITFAPSDPNVIYCNSDVGGMYKSSDSGKTWKMIHGSVNPALCNARDMNVDPKNSETVLAAIGDKWMPKQGIYRTTNSGKTWEKVCEAQFFGNAGGLKSGGRVFARHPQNPDVIYAASIDGLFKSNDNGKTWQNTGLIGYAPTELKMDLTQPGRMWFSGRKTGSKVCELFISEDSGKSWQKLSATGLFEMIQPQFAPEKLYAIFDNKYVACSIDKGKSWQKVVDGLELTVKNKPAQFRALGAGPDFILLASSAAKFYRLNKGETTWQKLPYSKHQKNWFLKDGPGKYSHFARCTSSITVNPTNPDNWFFTDWYAVYQTMDAGKNWHLMIDGIEMVVVHTLVADPTLPGKIFLGMADNAVAISYDDGESFQQCSRSSKGNTKNLAISKLNPMRIYCTGPRHWSWESTTVRISMDGGKTWTKCPMKDLKNDGKQSLSTLITSPIDEFTLYVTKSGSVKPGEGGVYTSKDGGKTFFWDSKGFAEETKFFKHGIWRSGPELAVASDGNAMVAIGQKNPAIYYRINDGEWQKSNSSIPGYHYSVVADPFNPKRFFLASKNGGFHRSDDGGKTWQKIFNQGTCDIAMDPVKKDRLAISLGKEEKLYLSNDGGDSWTELDNNLPNRKSVKLCFSGDRLIAGTDGNGVFYLPLTHQAIQGKKATPRQLKKVSSLVSLDKQWTKWSQKGDIKISYFDGILTLEGQNDANTVSASQIIKPENDIPLKLSGKLKLSDENNTALIAIQAFNKKWQQTQFLEIFASNKSTDWQSFSKTIIPPENAEKMVFSIILKGKGNVCVKELNALEESKYYR